jgi:hypothetical protein
MTEAKLVLLVKGINRLRCNLLKNEEALNVEKTEDSI